MHVFGDPVFGDHVAFVGTDTKCCFEIWLYEIMWWDCMRAVRTALPSFCVLGRTWEGVTEVQACPAYSPYPEDIVAQMQWVIEFVDAKGWKCDG